MGSQGFNVSSGGKIRLCRQIMLNLRCACQLVPQIMVEIRGLGNLKKARLFGMSGQKNTRIE